MPFSKITEFSIWGNNNSPSAFAGGFLVVVINNIIVGLL